MDRNDGKPDDATRELVATREGGVDRNQMACISSGVRASVATREGGVDRNSLHGAYNSVRLSSPPARVAWIETL